MRLRVAVGSFLVLLLLVAFPLDARVTRVEIASRTDVLGGKTFGDAGSLRAHHRTRLLLAPCRQSAQRAHRRSRQRGELEERRSRVLRRLHGSSAPRTRTRATARCCLKFPTAGMAASLHSSTAATGMPRTTRATAGCCAHGFTIVSLGWQWDAAGSRRAAILCAGCERKWKDHHRSAARRSDAVESDAGDSARPPHSGQYRRDEYPVAASRRPTQRADRPRLARREAHRHSSLGLAVRADRRRQAHSERPAHPPERRFSAREDLRIRLCGRRSCRGRRRLRCDTRLRLVCQARS